MPNRDLLWRTLRQSGVKYVRFVIIDIYGRPRCQLVPIDESKDFIEQGLPFDGSSIPAYSTVDKSDLVAVADERAVYLETWNGSKIASIFTTVESPMDPRGLLKGVVDNMVRSGYTPRVGFEVEFFIVKLNGIKPELVDNGAYSDVSMPIDLIDEILTNMRACGIGGSRAHHEVAPSQYEVNIPPGDPVEVADKLIMFKIMARDLLRRHGLCPTFMPKPFWGVNGSGLHTHFSLWRNGRNLFYYEGGEMPEELLHSVAGLLDIAREISSVVAPTVNSYKRLVPHYEAPTRITWGLGNRSVMVRIPYYRGRADRVEYRHPDPSQNPYLSLSLELAAIRRGLELKLKPPDPTEGVAYELPNAPETPANLGEAVELLEKSNMVISILPRELIAKYVQLKRHEWESYLKEVGPWESSWNVITDWEYEKYLTTA